MLLLIERSGRVDDVADDLSSVQFRSFSETTLHLVVHTSSLHVEGFVHDGAPSGISFVSV